MNFDEWKDALLKRAEQTNAPRPVYVDTIYTPADKRWLHAMGISDALPYGNANVDR